MLRRTPLRLSAAVASVAVAALAAGPAFAASPVTGSATALKITVAGQSGSSGTYTATRTDGRETTQGSRSPSIPAPGGTQRFKSGVLTQDAITNANGTLLRATACSGLADSGSALTAGGSGVTCTKSGAPISVVGGSVDLSKLGSDPTKLGDTLRGTILASLPTALQGPLASSVNTLTAALVPMFQADLDSLGSAQVRLNLKAIEGRCTAVPGEASGGARIIDAGLVISFPDATGVGPIRQSVLPADPKPNTKVTRDLSKVGDLVTTSLQASVTQYLVDHAAAGDALQPLVAALQASDATAKLAEGLGTLSAPLDANILSLTLNRQTRPAAGSIRETALVLTALPAAAQLITGGLGSLEVGDATCTAEAAATTTTTTTTAVPTRIDSGTSGSSGSGPAGAVLLLGGLALLAGAGAGVGVRRIRR